MLELVGYIVACKSSEGAVARVTVGTSITTVTPITTVASITTVHSGVHFVGTATGTADFP